MVNPHHSIKTASRMTGLSAHLIRIWEKRYGAVAPKRTATNRRLYSDAEIERLNLLRLATAAGHSIGNIAKLPLARLKSLVAKAQLSGRSRSAHPVKRAASPAQTFHDSCLAAVEGLDARGLEEMLRKAVIALGHQGLLRHSVYHRPNGWDHVPRGQRVPNGESSMWGDYHMRELALLLLREARGECYLTFFDYLRSNTSTGGAILASPLSSTRRRP